MAAGAPQIVFQANLQAAYAAFAQFQAYVQANPVGVTFGGGAGGNRPGVPGLGGGPTTINNYYYNYGNVTNQGPGGGGPGGAGGGSGGGGGGSRDGGFGRFFRTAFVAREALRAADAYVSYQESLSGATGPEGRLKAELALQNHLYSLPIVGQIAQLDTAGNRLKTQQILQQSEQQGKFNDLLERGVGTRRQFAQGADLTDAGAAGSYGRRSREAEFEYERDRLRIEKERSDKDELTNQRREQARSQAEATANLDKLKYGALVAFNPALASTLAKSLGIKTPAELDAIAYAAGQGADASQTEAVRKSKEQRDQELALARKIAADRQDEINYQRIQETVRAQGRTDVAKLEFERKGDVADVVGTYNAGRARIEAQRQGGNIEAAAAEAETLRYQLERLKFKLQFGGGAESFDPFTQDFGQGAGGYHQNDPLRVDDLKEAIDKSNEYLSTLPEVLAELRAM